MNPAMEDEWQDEELTTTFLQDDCPMTLYQPSSELDRQSGHQLAPRYYPDFLYDEQNLFSTKALDENVYLQCGQSIKPWKCIFCFTQKLKDGQYCLQCGYFRPFLWRCPQGQACIFRRGTTQFPLPEILKSFPHMSWLTYNPDAQIIKCPRCQSVFLLTEVPRCYLGIDFFLDVMRYLSLGIGKDHRRVSQGAIEENRWDQVELTLLWSPLAVCAYFLQQFPMPVVECVAEYAMEFLCTQNKRLVKRSTGCEWKIHKFSCPQDHNMTSFFMFSNTSSCRVLSQRMTLPCFSYKDENLKIDFSSFLTSLQQDDPPRIQDPEVYINASLSQALESDLLAFLHHIQAYKKLGESVKRRETRKVIHLAETTDGRNLYCFYPHDITDSAAILRSHVDTALTKFFASSSAPILSFHLQKRLSRDGCDFLLITRHAAYISTVQLVTKICDYYFLNKAVHATIDGTNSLPELQ